MKFKMFILAFLALFSLVGCASKGCDVCYGRGGERTDIGGADKFYFSQVMSVPTDCSQCEGKGGSLFINGIHYRSDVAIRCCLEKNMIDTNIGLKKVYFHRFTDERESARTIKFYAKNGKNTTFNTNPRLETLFYMFLETELKSRGIMVVDTQTSPYTYRLDFAFESLNASYDRNSEILNGRLSGKMSLKNINFNRQIGINTSHHVEKLQAERSEDFDFFVALLVKQAAIKVANEISKL